MAVAPVVAFVEPMEREVDNHDAVLLHDAHEQEQADDGVKRERGAEKPERHQSAHDRREESRKHGNRMHIALVENAEDDIHDEDRGDDEERQRLEELLQDEAFALQLAFDRRRQDFGGRFLDEVGDIAERHARFGVETEGDAGELVEVIDRLQPERSSSISSRARIGISVSAVIGFHIDLREDPPGRCAPHRRPRR